MPKLYPEDQERVDAYLASSTNKVERKPFSPLALLGVIFVCLVVLTLVSYVIAFNEGLV